MAHFTLHDETTAPEGALPHLVEVRQKYGMIPNVLAILAENPAALEGYVALAGIFSKAGFTPLEAQIVTITSSVENECHFCVAAHSATAAAARLDGRVIDALRNGTAIADAKLESLRVFTRKVVTQRGFVSDADVALFRDAGYSNAAVLGVILGVALKVISNYTNHVAETPLNPAFAAFAWASAQPSEVESA